MTPERFIALLDAYGADPQRWPEAEREAGRALATAGPADLRERVAHAAALDASLAAHTVAGADADLMRRIMAGSPVGAPTAMTQGAQPWWANLSWLWPGAGFAGAGFAGSVAGAVAVSVVLGTMPPQRVATDWPERATAFSEVSADWSEE